MRRILVYIIVVIIVFSGYQEIKQIWQENEKDLDDTYAEVKAGIFSWYDNARETSQELKEKLNTQISDATNKYETIKADIEATTKLINEKKAQLDQTLKEMEEAKKALDELLEKDKEANVTAESETTVSAE